jgi:hypothetical protein
MRTKTLALNLPNLEIKRSTGMGAKSTISSVDSPGFRPSVVYGTIGEPLSPLKTTIRAGDLLPGLNPFSPIRKTTNHRNSQASSISRQKSFKRTHMRDFNPLSMSINMQQQQQRMNAQE